MKPELSNLPLDVIALIKYSLLVDGVSLKLLSKHFVTKYNQPIFPEEILVSDVDKYLRSNIRRSLHSFQHSIGGRSSYQPLPQDYDPSHFIRPKPESEYIILPLFTHQIWKSQFSQDMSPSTFVRQHIGEILSPRTGSNQRAPSSFSTTTPFTGAGGQADALSNVTPVTPVILGCNVKVLPEGVHVYQHLKVTLSDSGVSFIGYGINVFVAFVNNAITKKGYKHHALILGTVSSVPFHQASAYVNTAYIGSDNRTVFLPMVYGMELSMLKQTCDKLVSKTDVIGHEKEQLKASFSAIKEHAGEYATQHAMIAITFDRNLPYDLSPSGLFQDETTLKRRESGLTPHLHSNEFRLIDQEVVGVTKEYTFHQSSKVYIIPTNAPPQRVSFLGYHHYLLSVACTLI